MSPSDPQSADAALRDALSKITDPVFGADPIARRLVGKTRVDGSKAHIELVKPSPFYPADALEASIREALAGTYDELRFEARLEVPHAHALLSKNEVPGVKNVIAVSSGKGGVGKSTVAVNLACALRAAGARVGILDADVYGPNVPIMLGANGKPSGEQGKIQAVEAHGLQVMSMAFLVPEDQPIIWRGPMLHSAMKQFLFDVQWNELDYLIVDLPPGTGDAQLSLAQQSHLMGAVVVTTPQEVSVLDVRRAIKMFEQVNVPVLGIVENMAGFALRGQIDGEANGVSFDATEGHTEVAADGSFEVEIDVFGSGGGDKIAETFGLPLLGRIPLDPACRLGGDRGEPIALRDDDRLATQRVREVAAQVSYRVAEIDFENAEAMSV